MTRFFVYGRRSCPYCVKAVRLLEGLEAEFYFFEDESREEIDRIKNFYGVRTVPVILENDKTTGKVSMIGGYSDLERIYG